MLVFSTPDSIRQREVTVAALAEALAAAAISIALAVQYGTIKHIAIAACLAPFSLMRSEASVALGMKWFFALCAKSWPLKNRTMLAYIAIWSPIIRIVTPLCFAVSGVKSIPANWVRVVLCEDIRTNVEMVPGWGTPVSAVTKLDYLRRPDAIISTASSLFQTIIWIYAIAHASNRSLLITCIILSVVFAGVAVQLASPLPLYLLALIYRLSVKSTFYIWLPIIYVVNDTFDSSVSAKAKLEIMRSSSLARITRFVSWLVLGIFAWKVLMLPSMIEFGNSTYVSRVLNLYITPYELHVWQVIAAVNSFLTLACFYYFFEKAPILIADGCLSEQTATSRLKIFRFINGMLSLYTISVMLYLTIIAGSLLTIPKLSWQLWPN